MKRTIFPKDFAPYYPIGILPCPMYVDVANRIYERIKGTITDLPYAHELEKAIALNTAMYYEDKVSGLGLWNSFEAWHNEFYSTELPFYFTVFEKFDKEDVNLTEVKVLIWLVISRYFSDRFLNPFPMVDYMARMITEILTEADEVEINQQLYDFIYDKNNANDYFKLKKVLFWLRRSYLHSSPLSEDFYLDILDSFEEKLKKNEATYFAETTFLMTTEIGPMALLPHLWLSKMFLLKEFEETYPLRTLEYVQQDVFFVSETNTEYAFLKDSKGEVRKVKNDHPNKFRTGAYVCSALVRYNDNDWEINGLLAETNKQHYYKTCEHQQTIKHSYEKTYPLFMERTKGKRLAFFENKTQLKDWMHDIAPEIDTDDIDDKLPTGPQVAFISKKSGIIFAPKKTHAIKCEYNPYYRDCDASTLQTETLDALLNFEAMHPEMLHYLLDNKMLQDGNISSNSPSEQGNKIFNENIDFIARNHRRHFYHDYDF